MLTLVFLLFAGFAAAAPPPQGGKIIPLFEDWNVAGQQDPLEAQLQQRSWCVEDCHHHILDKPVFMVARASGAEQGHYTVTYNPQGLTGMAKSAAAGAAGAAGASGAAASAAAAAAANELLSGEQKIAVLFPHYKFPFQLFPGLLETDFPVPQHQGRLGGFYKQAPILAVFSEEDFKKFLTADDKRGYVHFADLAVEDSTFSVKNDYAHVAKITAYKTSQGATPIIYLVPAAHNPNNQDAAAAAAASQGIASLKDWSRISTSELYRVIPASNINNPANPAVQAVPLKPLNPIRVD